MPSDNQDPTGHIPDNVPHYTMVNYNEMLPTPQQIEFSNFALPPLNTVVRESNPLISRLVNNIFGRSPGRRMRGAINRFVSRRRERYNNFNNSINRINRFHREYQPQSTTDAISHRLRTQRFKLRAGRAYLTGR